MAARVEERVICPRFRGKWGDTGECKVSVDIAIESNIPIDVTCNLGDQKDFIDFHPSYKDGFGFHADGKNYRQTLVRQPVRRDRRLQVCRCPLVNVRAGIHRLPLETIEFTED